MAAWLESAMSDLLDDIMGDAIPFLLWGYTDSFWEDRIRNFLESSSPIDIIRR